MNIRVYAMSSATVPVEGHAPAEEAGDRSRASGLLATKSAGADWDDFNHGAAPLSRQGEPCSAPASQR